MLKKYNMILNSVDQESKRGVLSIEAEENLINGQLRLYGFDREPSGIITLGIISKGSVIKAGLTKKSNMLYTFSSQNAALSDGFSCAVINFVGGEPKPILFGSQQNLETQLDDVLGALRSSENMDEVEQALDEYGIDYDDELKEAIEKQIDEQLHEAETENLHSDQEVCVGDCKNCIYKQSFYQGEQQNSDKNREISIQNDKKTSKIEENDEKVVDSEPKFYGKIKDQVDQLFTQNKEEEFLSSAIPQSKWVKVELNDGGDYYVFGLIYDDEELKFICYGVPGIYTPLPPKQLSGYPVWFPVDKDKKDGFGYWLTYQDASTGESVKAIIE